jgi:alpha-L-arabinofuranosidase
LRSDSEDFFKRNIWNLPFDLAEAAEEPFGADRLVLHSECAGCLYAVVRDVLRCVRQGVKLRAVSPASAYTLLARGGRSCQWFLIPTAIVISAITAASQPVTAGIDATQTGKPITKLIFGGFMEPATTNVWAEMLADRKFFNEVTSRAPAAPAGGFGRRGAQRRWTPVGGDGVVTMDSKKPYVGEWSPLVKVEAKTAHGVSQSGIVLRAGKAYTGRVILAGTPGAKVSVSLIWGPKDGDRETVAIPAIAAEYAKFPLKFTPRTDANDGRIEITGTGVGSFRIGAVSLMPADNISGFKASNIRLLKEQGISIARWPGGNFVSAYDWRDGIGDADKRPPRRELAWSGMESNDMGLDDFMTFCRLTGAEPYIAVNSGLGDAHSAAEEVEYVNGPATSRLGRLRAANGHPAPYGVKIWGVGNEMYGPWQWGHIDVTQYPEKHNLIVKAMRAVDPKVKVIASSATPEELSWTYIENRQLATFSGRAEEKDRVPFGFGTKDDWTGALLDVSADYIDFLGEHFYGYPNLVIDAGKQAFVEATDPLEHRVRRMSNKVQMKFEAWDEYLKRMPKLKEKDIKFAFDEWAPRNRAVNPSNPAPGAGNPMLNTLTNALVYHEFFRHSDMVGLAIATGGMGTLATDAYGEAVGYRTDGLVIKLLHDRFAGKLPVAVTGQSPQPLIAGTLGVDLSVKPSGSPTYPLDVFAAISADHKKLAVSVINPTEKPQECNLNLTGVSPLGGAKVWQISASAGVAPVPAAVGPGRSVGGPPATMAEDALPQAPGRITLPPASINVYEFEVK